MPWFRQCTLDFYQFLTFSYYQYYYYYVTLYSFPIVFSLFLGCRIENCDTCYSRTFCSRCQPPYVGLYGKCVLQCPDSMYVNEMTSQCEVKGEIKWDFEIGCAGGKLPIISHIFTTIIRLNWTFKLSYGMIFTEIAPTMTNLLLCSFTWLKWEKIPRINITNEIHKESCQTKFVQSVFIITPQCFLTCNVCIEIRIVCYVTQYHFYKRWYIWIYIYFIHLYVCLFSFSKSTAPFHRGRHGVRA